MANEIATITDDQEDEPLSTAWSAEWFGPEEKIEDEEELAKVGVHVIYKDEKHFTWYYPQVHAALTEDKIREFVEYNGITDATDADIEELKAFFYHWIRFIMFDIDTNEHEGHVFEPEDINEIMGDDDVNDLTEELEKAGMKKKYEDLMNTKPTLH